MLCCQIAGRIVAQRCWGLEPDACHPVLKDDDMPISCAPDEGASSCRPIPGSVLDIVLSQQLLPGCRRVYQRVITVL